MSNRDSKLRPPISSNEETARVVQAVYDDLNTIVSDGLQAVIDPQRRRAYITVLGAGGQVGEQYVSVTGGRFTGAVEFANGGWTDPDEANTYDARFGGPNRGIAVRGKSIFLDDVVAFANGSGAPETSGTYSVTQLNASGNVAIRGENIFETGSNVIRSSILPSGGATDFSDLTGELALSQIEQGGAANEQVLSWNNTSLTWEPVNGGGGLSASANETITGEWTFTNNITFNGGDVYVYNHNTQTDRRLTINQGATDNPSIYNYDETDTTFYSMTIGGDSNTTSGITIDGSGLTTFHQRAKFSGDPGAIFQNDGTGQKLGLRVHNDTEGGSEAAIRFRNKDAAGNFLHADIALNADDGYLGFKVPHNSTAGAGYVLQIRTTSVWGPQHFRAIHSDNTNYGYFAFHRDDGTRGGYIGWGNGGNTVNITGDNASALAMTGWSSITMSGISYATDHRESSDRRLKSELRKVNPLHIARLAKNNLYSYKKEGLEERQIGQIAQGLEKAHPNIVGWMDHDKYEKGVRTLSGYTLGSIALAGVGELDEQVNSHEKRIQQLEEENDRLKKKIEILEAA